MEKERLATGGAIGASLLIASCCVGPAVFLLFGVSVSALGALTALEAYQPIFIAVGGLALLYAGYRIFRTTPAAAGADCDDDVCAPDGPARRTTRRLLVGAIVFYAFAIAYPYALEALL